MCHLLGDKGTDEFLLIMYNGKDDDRRTLQYYVYLYRGLLRRFLLRRQNFFLIFLGFIQVPFYLC